MPVFTVAQLPTEPSPQPLVLFFKTNPNREVTAEMKMSLICSGEEIKYRIEHPLFRKEYLRYFLECFRIDFTEHP